MKQPDPNDAELLADWLENRSELAFRRLVERYAGLVHMAAKRTCGDETIAAEASQQTFILLAGKAATLAARTSLAGWLHLTAVMQTKNLLRKSRREFQKRELLYADMETDANAQSAAKWKELQPVVDEAIAALPEKDREALLLHFYRSLSFREAGEVLGIAGEAARKRIERATEKLRGKLAARGVNAGGSLSSVMLVGMAADAEVVGLPVKAMAAKAMAAGSAGGAGSVATTAIFMKASSFVPPVLALVAAGLWIAPKREAVAAVERRTLTLEAGSENISVDRRTTERMRKPNGTGPAKSGTVKFDWEAIAMRLADERTSGRARSFRGIEEMLLDRRLEAMSTEELLAELERVEELDLSAEARGWLEEQLYQTIARTNPAFALEHFQRWLGIKQSAGFALTSALKRYVKDHPAEGTAWLDRQIAASRLEVRRLDGRNWDRDRLEGALLHGSMVDFPDRAASRLMAMGPKDRQATLGALPPRFPKEEQLAYAKVVRAAVDAGDQPKMIARLGLVLNEDYKWVDDYLGRIEASDAERAATYARAAKYSLLNTARSRKLTEREVGKAWEWMGGRLPEARGRLVGEALGFAWGDGELTGFEDVSTLVIQFNERVNDDSVLIAFLKSKKAILRKERSVQMAGMISDKLKRSEVLEELK